MRQLLLGLVVRCHQQQDQADLTGDDTASVVPELLPVNYAYSAGPHLSHRTQRAVHHIASEIESEQLCNNMKNVQSRRQCSFVVDYCVATWHQRCSLHLEAQTRRNGVETE